MQTEKRMIELYQQLLADAEYKMVQLQALYEIEQEKNAELQNRIDELEKGGEDNEL